MLTFNVNRLLWHCRPPLCVRVVGVFSDFGVGTQVTPNGGQARRATGVWPDLPPSIRSARSG